MEQARRFARIVVPAPLNEPLVYSVPETLREQIACGSRVLVPLQRRITTGIVLDFPANHSLAQTKSIIEVLDDQPILDEHLLNLCRWLAHYYVVSLGEALAAMLPPNSRRQSRRTVSLKNDQLAVQDELGSRVLAELSRYKGKISIGTLTRKFSGESISRTLARLESAGAIEMGTHLPNRRATKEKIFLAANQETAHQKRFSLTSEQEAAFRAIEGRIKAGGFETFLLHGVTGSGKTEVYLRAIEQGRELGRRSLIIIPEISLTPQILDRLNGRFPGRVGVLHSALTGAQRWAQWRQILSGGADVVIGARSAVFAPIPELGLIIVDEEHDSSYKQEDGVRYNGRDVAVVRGKLLDCPVILGSATPALETYENCRRGRYRLLELNTRVAGRPLPAIQAVDLRRQLDYDTRGTTGTVPDTLAQAPDRRLLSKAFADALQDNFRAGRQTLIFLNRRGFANFLQCSSCGFVWRCPHCSVTLTLHLKQSRLSCHHCEFRTPKTDLCPECKHPSLRSVGSGTERVEQALKQLLPQARVERMDRDTTGKRGAHEKIIRRWEKGAIDVLVGTQMITKGHDVSGVTLVGALLADLSLNLPDFRAAERTFQLLSQVAGRAGRGDEPGRVIIQTYAPDHYAIEHLVKHDYKGFFVAESEFRRALDYPPFSRLVNLRLDGPKLPEVESRAKELAAALREVQARNSKFAAHVQVLGPAAAPIEKLRNRYRWQLLLRAKHSATLLSFARQAEKLLPRSRGVRLHIDVDPNSML